MRFNKIATTTASVAVAALLLSACGGTSGTPETPSTGGDQTAGAATAIKDVSDADLEGTKITLGRMFGDCEETTQGVTDTDKATSECEAIQILTNKFNAENEHGIQVERLGGADWHSYYDAFNASLAGGDAPDIANIHDYALSDYAKRGQLLSFDPAEFDIDIADATDRAKASTMYDGQSYAVPFDSHAILWHINTDILEEAGWMGEDGRPVLPEGAEEVLQMGRDIKEKTGNHFMSIGTANDDMAWRVFYSLVQQQGAQLINDDGTVEVDSPEAVKALEFYQTMIEEGLIHTNADYAGSIDEWKNEKSAILVNGTWAVNEYVATSDFGYTVTDFPTVFETPAAWASSHMWVIPTQSDADPVQYRAAIEFAKYLYDNTNVWTISTGHFSPRVSVLESAEYTDAPERQNYIDTALRNIRFVPQIENWTATKDTIHTQLEEVWFNGKDVSAALGEAQARLSQGAK